MMIKIYIDNSGSMSEMDKLDVAKYIARGIKNAEIYTLNGNKVELDSIKFDNNKIYNVTNDGFKILLSDGLADFDEIKFDIAFAIGIDADKKMLEKVANKVFDIDDIMEFYMHIPTQEQSNNEWE